jgi:CheY-like chemotaxis protein
MASDVDSSVHEVLRARIRSPAVPTSGGDGLDSGCGHVLVVMEDLFLRKLVRRQLEDAGYGVTEALSVDRALQRVRAETPDIVLLDTWVDRGDGMRLLEALRADDEQLELPVLLIGSDTRADVRRRSEELGGLGPLPISHAGSVDLWVEEVLERGDEPRR